MEPKMKLNSNFEEETYNYWFEEFKRIGMKGGWTESEAIENSIIYAEGVVSRLRELKNLDKVLRFQIEDC